MVLFTLDIFKKVNLFKYTITLSIYYWPNFLNWEQYKFEFAEFIGQKHASRIQSKYLDHCTRAIVIQMSTWIVVEHLTSQQSNEALNVFFRGIKCLMSNQTNLSMGWSVSHAGPTVDFNVCLSSRTSQTHWSIF
jgi:hypothetical protein